MPPQTLAVSHSLPALPYAYDALEPHIDARTMEIHHTKHHGTYVNNLNAAIEKAPEIGGRSLDELLVGITSIPEAVRTAVRNNGGGHWNHSLFWQLMGPKAGGEPTGGLAEAIRRGFGDFAKFKEQFAAAAAARFGSGWVWLVRDGDRLSITSTPNQDNPLMEGRPARDILLGLDVWEHAYYLKYQNRRADYVTAWWNVVNWPAVAKRYS
jgi:Fe-Mn family superoxide dismutase